MKKLSKITESIWSDMQDRSAGEVRRKEDGVKVHTCIDVDIYQKYTSDSDYDDLIYQNHNCIAFYQISVKYADLTAESGADRISSDSDLLHYGAHTHTGI